MKYPCELIGDLMPLYCDGVCSPVSAEAITAHLAECEHCRALHQAMQRPVPIDQAHFAQQQAESIRQVKKKLRRSTVIRCGIFCAAAVAGLLLVEVLAVHAIFLALGMGNSTVEVHDMASGAASHYEEYIGASATGHHSGKYGMDEGIFPAELTLDMTVKDFRYACLDSFDTQYLACLDVAYSEADFSRELERLNRQQHDPCVGIYSVTGEPAGYRIVAQDAGIFGFIYAMVPEDGSPEVVYVMLVFGNSFMDIEPADYLPETCLLQGLDVSEHNPYRDFCMAELKRRGSLTENDILIMPDGAGE